MKVRNGFVSNSSSSSFTCDVCLITESGWDSGLEDVEMYECVNGHTFCESHTDFDMSDNSSYDTTEKKVAFIVGTGDYGKQIIKGEDVNKDDEDYDAIISDIFEEFWYDDISEIRSSVPSKHCPICSLTTLTYEDIVAYFYHVFNTDEETIIKEIKQKFGDYEGFKKVVK